MGVARTIVAKIHVDPEATEKFCGPRSVPYAIKGKIEQELQQLENECVTSEVVKPEWAALIVPVMKANGSVRLCRDYKVTLNQAIKSDSYPKPCTGGILASLAGRLLCLLVNVLSSFCASGGNTNTSPTATYLSDVMTHMKTKSTKISFVTLYFLNAAT